MAPNRNKKNENNGGGGQRNGHHHQPNNGMGRPIKCVRPTGCLEPDRMIYKEEIEAGDIDVIRVTCNNLQCDEGNFMHHDCFVEWEETVLNFLSSTGRARSWSVKQRLQNLWTKKGYDLAFKACDCHCGKGHLRKDLDWVSPKERNKYRNGGGGAPREAGQVPVAGAAGAAPMAIPAAGSGVATEEVGKKKKKSKAKENLPTLALSARTEPHPNDNFSRKLSLPATSAAVMMSNNGGNGSAAGSFDSGIGSGSASSNLWPVQNDLARPRVDSLSSNESGSSGGGSGSPPSPDAQFGSPVSSAAANAFKFQRKNSCIASGGGDRVRHNSTGTGFCRRTDFSSFNVLPKQKLNSYHIKMEDDGHGNDEMRTIILTVLMSLKVSKVSCCLCNGGLIIYDRYPLVDGTFFLSPRQHSKDSIPMNPNCMDGPIKYLSAVCMNCLEGNTSILFCRWCRRKWDGSSLILGGCYNYDVFAATPCCNDRRQCTNCGTLVQKSPNYFSEFSQQLRCERCGVVDFHLAKPIHNLFDRYTQRVC